MKDNIGDMFGKAVAPMEMATYVYSRTGFAATISRRNGLELEPCGGVMFATAKISNEKIREFAALKGLLQPQPHSPQVLEELDIEGNRKEVEAQAIFMKLLVERLNAPLERVEPLPYTSFAIEKTNNSYIGLLGFYPHKKLDEYLNKRQHPLTVYNIMRISEDGTYKLFASIHGCPEDIEKYKLAAVDAIYGLERALTTTDARPKNDPQQGGPGKAGPDV